MREETLLTIGAVFTIDNTSTFYQLFHCLFHITLVTLQSYFCITWIKSNGHNLNKIEKSIKWEFRSGGGWTSNREEEDRLLGYIELSIIIHFKMHDIFHY
jgi:hypothetical protein